MLAEAVADCTATHTSAHTTPIIDPAITIISTSAAIALKR
jgi:hypothetical protein